MVCPNGSYNITQFLHEHAHLGVSSSPEILSSSISIFSSSDLSIDIIQLATLFVASLYSRSLTLDDVDSDESLLRSVSSISGPFTQTPIFSFPAFRNIAFFHLYIGVIIFSLLSNT